MFVLDLGGVYSRTLCVCVCFKKALASREKDFPQSGHGGVMYIMGNTWLWGVGRME